METIYKEESLESITVEKGLPYSGSIEIITKCNFRCKHCYIPKHTTIMDKKMVISLIDQMQKMGVFELMLTGGEIFLHPDIKEIIAFARSVGLRVTLFTNLYALDEALVAWLSGKYVQEISTTLFSLNEDINDSITGKKGSVQKILQNAALVKKYGIPLEIKVPLLTLNKDSYYEIKQYCSEQGFKINHTTAITGKTDGNKEPVQYNLSEDEIRDLIKTEDLPVNKARGYREKDYLCPALRNSLHVDCGGNVYPCISFPYKIGNVKNASLIDIWNNSKERKYLMELRKERLTNCKSCNLADTCGRCPGLAYTEDGDLFGCSTLDKRIAAAKEVS